MSYDALPAVTKLQKLQRGLYQKAKQEPGYRFYCLYDKVWRTDVLWEAWRQVKQNRGAAGPDGVRIEELTKGGEEAENRWLSQLQEELRSYGYRPGPIRRVYIPKANGKLRPLGIPNVRDRVVQQAVRLVIDPIFEADFEEHSYGFRLHRGALQALQQVRQNLNQGRTTVMDADIEACLDRSSYCSSFHERFSKRPGCESRALTRKPLRFPRRRWIA